MEYKKYQQLIYGVFSISIVCLLNGALAGESNPVKSIQNNSRILDTGIFDGNRIRNDLENNGMIVSHRITGHSGMEWPKGTGTYINFASGVWLAGYVNGELRTAVAEYGPEYVPGPYGSDPYLAENKIYRVNRYDLDSPAGNPDFQNWPVDLGAPWVDVDGDGVYNPLPNGPDYPEILGDQELWFVINDGDSVNHTIFATQPLGVEIQTTIWGYDRMDQYGDMLFVKSLIINRGNVSIDSMFIGLWDDPDIGDATDDFVGCDTTLGLGFCYNDGADNDYGPSVPAIGYDFLQGPIVPAIGDSAIAFGQVINDYKNLQMTSFVKYINSADAIWSDPNDAQEAYNLMNGLMKDGNPYDYSITGGSHFVHPGDPLLDQGPGDSEFIDADIHPSGDRRFLMNSGAFNMAPGDSQEVIFSIIIARSTDNLASLSMLKQTDSLTQVVADNSYLLPEDTTFAQFAIVSDFQVVGDNLNDDGLINNGELIKLIFSVGNTTAETISTVVIVTPMSSLVNSESESSIIINELAPLPGQYTLTSDEAFYLYLQPEYSNNQFPLQIDIGNLNDGTWNRQIISLPVALLDYQPPDTVSWAEHIAGISDGRVGFRVVNPAEIQVANYQISFSNQYYDSLGVLADGLGINLRNLDTGVLVLDRHSMPDRYQFGFPITDGFKLVVEDLPANLKSISVIANGNGTLSTPADAVPYWYYPDYIVSGGDYSEQQTNGTVWFISMHPSYGIDENDFLAAVFAYSGGYGSPNQGLASIIPEDFELRFTDSGQAVNYWGPNQSILDVPFEWWNIGDADDPGDDYKLITYLLDEDESGTWNLMYDASDSSGGTGWADHPMSGGLNDPWTDRMYVLSPVDKTPGTQGYDNFMAQAASYPNGLPGWYAQPGDASGPLDAYNFASRLVLVLLNGGDVTTTTSPADYSAESPENGTIFRFTTNKVIDSTDVYTFNTSGLEVSPPDGIPQEFALRQNYPNPFNPITTIQYQLPYSSEVTLKVFDILGRDVITLAQGKKSSGFHSVVWDGRNNKGVPVSTGLYFYKLKAGQFVKIRKMLLLK
ncbi:MAG: T9SS type A sorting domain-containing protein [FCB group bacterium]|nr:T9SS type A sorting domain-containing protein [FCB group bacterium]